LLLLHRFSIEQKIIMSSREDRSTSTNTHSAHDAHDECIVLHQWILNIFQASTPVRLPRISKGSGLILRPTATKPSHSTP